MLNYEVFEYGMMQLEGQYKQLKADKQTVYEKIKYQMTDEQFNNAVEAIIEEVTTFTTASAIIPLLLKYKNAPPRNFSADGTQKGKVVRLKENGQMYDVKYFFREYEGSALTTEPIEKVCLVNKRQFTKESGEIVNLDDFLIKNMDEVEIVVSSTNYNTHQTNVNKAWLKDSWINN